MCLSKAFRCSGVPLVPCIFPGRRPLGRDWLLYLLRRVAFLLCLGIVVHGLAVARSRGPVDRGPVVQPTLSSTVDANVASGAIQPNSV